MNKNFIGALTGLAILTSGTAYAGNVAAPAMAPGVVSQAIMGVAGGEAYPQFGGPAVPVTSSATVAVNGQQYPRFRGEAGAIKTQRMIADNGQNYPSFETPSNQQVYQGPAYAQAAPAPAVPRHRGADRSS